MAADSPDIEVVGIDPDPLFAIAYTSTPTGPFGDRDLTNLLFSARRFNARHEITGRLLVLEEQGRVVRFLQWIEGPAPSLFACFERIEADDRHGDIQVRFRQAVTDRQYPTWDMAVDQATPVSFEVAVEAVGSDVDGLTASP